MAPQALRFWCQDESRFGLKTLPGKMITLPGIKPIGTTQWYRDAYWLYGTVEPATGECFVMEFSHVDSDCFQVFVEQFSALYPNEHHIMQVDNAAFHTARKIVLPDNVSLLFQPAHSPELNPAERFWGWLKQPLRTRNFACLGDLKETVWSLVQQASKDTIQDLTYWPHIQRAVAEYYPT